MTAELIIAPALALAGLLAAFAMALGKAARHADRRMDLDHRRALALAAISRESSTSVPPPRGGVDAKRVRVRLNAPPSHAAEHAASGHGSHRLATLRVRVGGRRGARASTM